MTDKRSVEVTNRVTLKDKAGYPVGFQGVDHYDVSALFSDTVDLPTAGYLYIATAGTLELMLAASSVALPYTFEQAGIYPILVKRIMSTGSEALTTYIVM